MANGVLDSTMIIPEKPCATNEIQESQPGDNQKMPTPDGSEAPADGTGRAGDGLRHLSVIFNGGFDFACVGQGGCRTHVGISRICGLEGRQPTVDLDGNPFRKIVGIEAQEAHYFDQPQELGVMIAVFFYLSG